MRSRHRSVGGAPNCAAPSLLFVQFLHVWSAASAYARPSGCDPVRISCMFGRIAHAVSPGRPFSVNALFFVNQVSRGAPHPACRHAGWRGRGRPIAPRALCHGPLPMRSRAFTARLPSAADVLMYALQVRLPAPAAPANFLAMSVRADEAAKVRTVAGSCARDEKGHRRRRLLLLRRSPARTSSRR